MAATYKAPAKNNVIGEKTKTKKYIKNNLFGGIWLCVAWHGLAQSVVFACKLFSEEKYKFCFHLLPNWNEGNAEPEESSSFAHNKCVSFSSSPSTFHGLLETLPNQRLMSFNMSYTIATVPAFICASSYTCASGSPKHEEKRNATLWHTNSNPSSQSIASIAFEKYVGAGLVDRA